MVFLHHSSWILFLRKLSGLKSMPNQLDAVCTSLGAVWSHLVFVINTVPCHGTNTPNLNVIEDLNCWWLLSVRVWRGASNPFFSIYSKYEKLKGWPKGKAAWVVPLSQVSLLLETTTVASTTMPMISHIPSFFGLEMVR
ncbi:hypothetical protein KC19_VG264100 [Ceratodon purpureus]|uniref:Uncharacterized protein n=1 Tax=Ceratodon purpureus TaxID=3225 RepID=A0A8T0HVB5_CERPU|nr:hypothetical protein KC19_VG264100 [Ceratodon purpureus]